MAAGFVCQTGCQGKGPSAPGNAAARVAPEGKPLPPALPSMAFVKIPAGRFTMGSTQNDPYRVDQNPPHPVTISRPFEVQATEVTQAQWQAVMGSNPSKFKGDDLPVEEVSWIDAQEFVRKLNERDPGKNYRLPTEAEWEYACRAGTKGDRYGDLAAVAWYERNAGNQTHPVGQKPPNAWGLHDMLGNVAEWCSDWREPLAESPAQDPGGPASGERRVYRGGNWFADANGVTATSRPSWGTPDFHSSDIGLRLARDASR